MDKKEVMELLESVQTYKQWADACDKIKRAHGYGYPDYWFKDVLQSGMADRILGRFGESTQMRIEIVQPGE